MKKFDTMGEDWTVTETGTGTDRKAEQEPEWAGNRSMKRQKYRKRIAYNERLRKCKER